MWIPKQTWPLSFRIVRLLLETVVTYTYRVMIAISLVIVGRESRVWNRMVKLLFNVRVDSRLSLWSRLPIDKHPTTLLQLYPFNALIFAQTCSCVSIYLSVVCILQRNRSQATRQKPINRNFATGYNSCWIYDLEEADKRRSNREIGTSISAYHDYQRRHWV